MVQVAINSFLPLYPFSIPPVSVLSKAIQPTVL